MREREDANARSLVGILEIYEVFDPIRPMREVSSEAHFQRVVIAILVFLIGSVKAGDRRATAFELV
jgi:hypothetical protein